MSGLLEKIGEWMQGHPYVTGAITEAALLIGVAARLDCASMITKTDTCSSYSNPLQELSLDEILLIETFGDYLRTDVFPGKRGSLKIHTSGNSSHYGFYFLRESGETVLLLKFGKDGKVQSLYSPLRPSKCVNFLRELDEVDPVLFKYLKSVLSDYKTKENELGEVKIKGGVG